MRLARLGKIAGPASTASRLDAFLLPESLKFAEYNGESPAGAGYTETLGEIFLKLPLVPGFDKSYEIHTYPLIAKLLDALVMTYLDWGGPTKRPQILITDWREVPTWSEFEILKERFEEMGLAVELADPRNLHFDGKQLTANGKKIDLVYRRVLMNDIVARAAEGSDDKGLAALQRKCGQEPLVCERALAHVAGVEPGAEPAHALGRGAVGEGLGRNVAL